MNASCFADPSDDKNRRDEVVGGGPSQSELAKSVRVSNEASDSEPAREAGGLGVLFFGRRRVRRVGNLVIAYSINILTCRSGIEHRPTVNLQHFR